MITNHKISSSGRPGKPINHFLINNNWFLVDLPGYGYAKVSKKPSIFHSLLIILKQENNRLCFCID
jgi:GTP-binding protein